jgi:hypothetical protein
MDNKKLLVGGLAVVGAIALFMYLKPKPKKNSEGFFGADGRTSRMFMDGGTGGRNGSGLNNGQTAPPKSMGGNG